MSCSAAFVVGCPMKPSMARNRPPNAAGLVIAARCCAFGEAIAGNIELAAIYDVLVRWDPATGKYEMGTAESLTPSADFLEWTLKIKPGIMYAPHPAFAKDAKGDYVYHDMKREDVVHELETITTVWRGDETEVEGLKLLAHLYTEDSRYRDAFPLG